MRDCQSSRALLQLLPQGGGRSSGGRRRISWTPHPGKERRLAAEILGLLLSLGTSALKLVSGHALTGSRTSSSATSGMESVLLRASPTAPEGEQVGHFPLWSASPGDPSWLIFSAVCMDEMDSSSRGDRGSFVQGPLFLPCGPPPISLNDPRISESLTSHHEPGKEGQRLLDQKKRLSRAFLVPPSPWIS